MSPRLRQIHLPDVESAVEGFELLEHDHVLAASLHAEVEALAQRCLAYGSLEPTDAEAFGKAIDALVAIYKHHITVDDNFVFPLAARLLSPPTKRTK